MKVERPAFGGTRHLEQQRTRTRVGVELRLVAETERLTLMNNRSVMLREAQLLWRRRVEDVKKLQ